MDDFGLAMNVTDFVQLVWAIKGYCESIRDAPKDADAIRQQLNMLSKVLELLQKQLEKSSQLSRNDFTSSPMLREEIMNLGELIKEMNDGVKEASVKGLRKLSWPFKKEKNEEYFKRIGRSIDLLHLTLEIKNSFDSKIY
jgi:hypothetical protein